MTKAELIGKIGKAINNNAEITKDTKNPGKKFDADMFFTLAFMKRKELLKICKEANIK